MDDLQSELKILLILLYKITLIKKYISKDCGYIIKEPI